MSIMTGSKKVKLIKELCKRLYIKKIKGQEATGI